MGKDDPLALALIGGQRAMTADVQFEFLFGTIVADLVHAPHVMRRAAG
jgi:hypothetical protein